MLLRCRGTEVLESTVRQHIGACFAALEQRVLATLGEASHQLATGNNNPTDKLISQVQNLSYHLAILSQTCCCSPSKWQGHLTLDTKGSTNDHSTNGMEVKCLTAACIALHVS